MGPPAPPPPPQGRRVYFAWDPLRSYFDERHEKRKLFLNVHFFTTVLRVVFELFMSSLQTTRRKNVANRRIGPLRLTAVVIT